MNPARTSFSRLHPLATIVLFGCEVVLAAFSFQPLCALIAFVGAELCIVQLFDSKHAVRQLVWYVPIIVLMTVINPFFRHLGLLFCILLDTHNCTQRVLCTELLRAWYL